MSEARLIWKGSITNSNGLFRIIQTKALSESDPLVGEVLNRDSLGGDKWDILESGMRLKVIIQALVDLANTNSSKPFELS